MKSRTQKINQKCVIILYINQKIKRDIERYRLIKLKGVLLQKCVLLNVLKYMNGKIYK